MATVQQLRANGVELLAIPENYYDDLEARTDLRAERLDVLRRHNILYDRDEAGEYLQAYTRAFEGLFFFEIVERRAYTGFGAVNASIRLAAQARELARLSGDVALTAARPGTPGECPCRATSSTPRSATTPSPTSRARSSATADHAWEVAQAT